MAQDTLPSLFCLAKGTLSSLPHSLVPGHPCWDWGRSGCGRRMDSWTRTPSEGGPATWEQARFTNMPILGAAGLQSMCPGGAPGAESARRTIRWSQDSPCGGGMAEGGQPARNGVALLPGGQGGPHPPPAPRVPTAPGSPLPASTACLLGLVRPQVGTLLAARTRRGPLGPTPASTPSQTPLLLAVGSLFFRLLLGPGHKEPERPGSSCGRRRSGTVPGGSVIL